MTPLGVAIVCRELSLVLGNYYSRGNMMKSTKMLVLAAALTLGTLSAASASERQYDPNMPRWAVQQHEQYAESLERAAVREAKRAEANKARAEVVSASPIDGNAVAKGGAIATIIIIAAMM